MVLEPEHAVPVPEERAGAAPVVTLRDPRTDEAIERIVRAFVRALADGRDADLRATLTREARPFEPGWEPAVSRAWALRRRRLQELAGAGVDSLGYLKIDLWGETDPSVRDLLRPGEFLVKVTVDTSPRTEFAPLIETFVLILRLDHGALRIAGEATSP